MQTIIRSRVGCTIQQDLVSKLKRKNDGTIAQCQSTPGFYFQYYKQPWKKTLFSWFSNSVCWLTVCVLPLLVWISCTTLVFVLFQPSPDSILIQAPGPYQFVVCPSSSPSSPSPFCDGSAQVTRQAPMSLSWIMTISGVWGFCHYTCILLSSDQLYLIYNLSTWLQAGYNWLSVFPYIVQDLHDS